MPGIPCVYYGSEWGARARKEEGDPALRACFEKPQWNALCDLIGQLSTIRKQSPALNYGSFRSVFLTNRQCILERRVEEERILVAINADGEDFYATFDAGCETGEELLTGKIEPLQGGCMLPAYSVKYLRTR